MKLSLVHGTKLLLNEQLKGGVPKWSQRTGLENRRRESDRGFESHPLRHMALFFNNLQAYFNKTLQPASHKKNGRFPYFLKTEGSTEEHSSKDAREGTISP
jgi:hypothetical protein